MIRSLRRQAPEAQVWVLCLSPQAETILTELKEPGVSILSLSDFEAGDEALALAKSDGRSTVEYYFTITPSLIRYIMGKSSRGDTITYLDGDLWFTANPEPIYDEMGNASVLIIPHRFAKSHSRLEKFGVYNVGWITFRNDANGHACLGWWRDRNNEWCFDRLDSENGRYADQKYLDYFQSKFPGVHILSHRGANLAPWNLASTVVTILNGRLVAGDDLVLFFHFHGLKRLSPNRFLTIHRTYGARVDRIVRDRLYLPYLFEVLAIEAIINVEFETLNMDAIREQFGARNTFFKRVKTWLNILRSTIQGYVIVLPD